MESIDIGILRAKLRRVLAAVKHGATFEIRDSGIPIAVLRPAPKANPLSGLNKHHPLRDLARLRKVRLGRRPRHPDAFDAPPLVVPGVGLVDTLLEERRTGR